jgi:hypothetical protein
MALRKDIFWDQLIVPRLWEQSKIPSWIYMQPSGEMANPTQPRMMTSNLASFYTSNSEPSKMPALMKSNKKSSPPASSPKLKRRILHGCNVLYHNSPFSPFSSPCIHANSSKSNSKRNKEPKYFTSKTFDSSTTVGLSTTTIPPSNMPTASTSLWTCRKKTKRTTLQHLCHWATTPFAQSKQQLPSFVKSNPTREPTSTLQSL